MNLQSLYRPSIRGLKLSFVEIEFYYWAYFVFSIFIKCLQFQFITGLNSITPFISPINSNMLLSTMGVILAIVALHFMLYNKNRLLALFIGNLVISLLLLADTLYFRYYYRIITIPVLTKINLTLVGSVNESVTSLLHITDIFYLIDLPIIFFIYLKIKDKCKPKVRLKQRSICALISLAIGISLIFSISQNPDIRISEYSDSFQIKNLGVIYSHVDGTVKYVKKNILSNAQLTLNEKLEIEDFFRNKPKGSMQYNGAAAGKNLIVIQAESLQEFVINREINGHEITPNLNKLLETSVYFNNLYYQTADGNTSDAEFLLNTSLYPLSKGSVFHDYPSNSYNSLPRMLSEDYNSYTLHAFPLDFWNRYEMYDSLGFNKYIDHTFFEMDDFAGWQGQALSDVSFFRQSFDLMDINSPFYSCYVTLSSHYPYTYFEDYEYDAGEFNDTLLGNYIKSMHYLDKAIGTFIDDLIQRDLYDDSLLVIFGDHSGVPKVKSEELMEFLFLEDNELVWTKLQKVPLIIHLPGVLDKQTIETTGGQIDMLPTIMNLMNLNSPYVMGKDLLNNEDGYAVLRNGSVITDEYIFISDNRTLYDLATGQLLEFEAYEEEIKPYLYELYISDLIVEKNGLETFLKDPTNIAYNPLNR